MFRSKVWIQTSILFHHINLSYTHNFSVTSSPILLKPKLWIQLNTAQAKNSFRRPSTFHRTLSPPPLTAAAGAMPETRADADDVELPVADPATAPPPHVVVRIPDVDGKSDGCRRLTAVEKPPSLCDIILLGCIKALISVRELPLHAVRCFFSLFFI